MDNESERKETCCFSSTLPFLDEHPWFIATHLQRGFVESPAAGDLLGTELGTGMVPNDFYMVLDL